MGAKKRGGRAGGRGGPVGQGGGAGRVIKKGGTGQQAKQGRRQQQLRTGEGAGRRLHPPSSRHGSRQGPSSFLVPLAARKGSSAARCVRCRGGTLLLLLYYTRVYQEG